jgi:hypothetical protein
LGSLKPNFSSMQSKSPIHQSVRGKVPGKIQNAAERKKRTKQNVAER